MKTPTTETSPVSGILLALLLACWTIGAGATEPGFSASGLIDVRAVHTDAEHSWLNRGPDKLRYDESDGPLQLADLGVELRYGFDLQSEFKVQLHHYSDPERSVELTEAYFQHRTVGSGRWRSQYRIGAFYPPFSLENYGPLWTSPYTLSSSALNTWIGEEIRTVGAEGRWTWYQRPGATGHRLSGFASLFGYNDTMGAMISWRGWAVHDRQTGLNGTLPIRALPIIVYSDHSREFEPFMEIDDHPGFYVGVEWGYGRNFRLQLAHYDNLADDTLRQDDQYGWRTDFQQAAAHWRIGEGLELLGQYMTGRTIMVRDVVVNDFDAAYLMLVRTWGRHRLAARVETFGIDDVDGRPFDFNGEGGDSQTVSYSYLFRKHWKLSLEATRFFSRHEARQHFEESVARTAHQLSASLRYYFQAP